MRVLVLFALLGIALASANIAHTVLYGHLPHGWKKLHRAAPSERVPMIFAVKQKNMDKLESILLDISHPESASFGQHMTLEEIRKLTSDPPSAARIVAWIAKEAKVPLSKIVITPGRDFIHVTLTAQAAEKLFQTEFHHFEHPRSGKKIISSSKFSLPQHIHDSVDFVTASSVFPETRPGAPRRTNVFEGKEFEFDEQGKVKAWPAGFLYPQLLWSVYNIGSNPTINNPASTNSVYENLLQSFSPSDLATFQSAMSLPQVPINNVIGPNNASDCIAEPNNCGEANLDVQWLLSVAQNAQTTFWSIDNSDQYPFMDWIIAVSQSSNPPLVHSVSYGDIEQEGSPVNVMQRFNQEVMKLGARGVTVIVASGDDGVANFIARGNASACGFNPSYPATAPYVTAVGATQGPESNQTEIACTSATGGGITTGGGFSTVFPRPSWQNAAVQNYLQNGPNLPPTSMFNSAGRAYPDVAVLGHNYIMVVGGQFTAADGTSASAPVFAGMITLINAQRLSAGKKPIGFLNQILYNLAATNPAVFNDVTSGENNCCAGQAGQQVCCQYGFTATQGWDPLTGFGSINFPLFSQALLALP